MDAVTLINEHVDIEKVLHHYDFDKVRGEGGMLRACCKVHGGNNPTSFVANPDNGFWTCHSNCGSGDVYTLVMAMEQITFPQAVKWVANFFGIDISTLQITERKYDYVKEMKKWLQMMKKSKKKEIEEYQIKEEVRPVAKFREFREDTLIHFGLGHVETVELRKKDGTPYKLHNRLVFPIHFDGKQVGIAFRRVRGSDYPKWSNQPVSLEAGNILYNFDNVKNNTTIIVSEGITDVWAWHEIGLGAVATFGAHLTDEQYKLLLRTGADIVLAYDGDSAGRESTEKAIKSLRYKANLYTVAFKDGEDPESIGREELRKRYDERRRI